MFKKLFFSFFLLLSAVAFAQPITGVWKGKIGRQRAEVKIVQKGDSLTGTSYYFDGPNSYRRYSIKGYFNQTDNSVVWWDDALLEEKGGRLPLLGPGVAPMLSSANFNCPGGGEMLLDGSTHPQEKEEATTPLHLQKFGNPQITDEWDYVIDNFTQGTNDPYIIDSVALVSSRPAPKKAMPVKADPPIAKKEAPRMVAIPPMPQPVAKKEPVVTAPVTVEEKFTARKKTFALDIPIEGDSIEMRFYDNAEIDGDSISLFLNDRLLFQHIRLAATAYTIKLPVADLQDNNELVMVAENLGTIPPNTSYMIAEVGGKRYEARLASTENSSALIRLTKSMAVRTGTQ